MQKRTTYRARPGARPVLAALVLAASLAGCSSPGAPAGGPAEAGPGGVPVSGGIGTSGLCGSLPQGRVPATCAGI